MTFPRSTDIVAQYAGPVVYFVGTNLPDLTLELAYSRGGGPVVLKQGVTTATAACSISRKGSRVAVTTPTATVIDSNNGLVSVTYGSFTFGAPGVYTGQVMITMPDATKLPSQRFLIVVEENVGGLS